MTTAMPTLSPVLRDIHVNVVSAEEASLGLAEFWSGDRLIAFTRIEDGDLALRIGPAPTACCSEPTPSQSPRGGQPPPRPLPSTQVKGLR